ncbi:MAG: restriction endonuclease [Betaproteobacteria bacterium]|nr:restriction endonuclease [Betaproteobacteria bacterium]
MNKNSLFAVLLRSPWWISIAVAAGAFALARMLLPASYAPYALFTALPFLVIGGYAGWQQLRAPSATRIKAALEAIRALSWDDFSSAIEEAYRRDGYSVNRLNIAGADLELTKSGRVSLVACKRWKVARAGVEPLRELEAVRLARAAQECVYVSAGEITDKARAYAVGKNIRLLQSTELAQLLSTIKHLGVP